VTIEDRVASLETRLLAAEAQLRVAQDHAEILRLLNTYGPLVDCGEGDAAARLWIEGGGHNIDGLDRFIAYDHLASMYNSAPQIEMNAGGCAHILCAPRITIHDDTAEAFAYVFVLRKEGDRWYVWRASVNYFDLVRTPDGWRFKEKYNRPVDGSQQAQDTMRRVKD
jgi:hypothetical protein